jgi:hypothetical protein
MYLRVSGAGHDTLRCQRVDSATCAGYAAAVSYAYRLSALAGRDISLPTRAHRHPFNIQPEDIPMRKILTQTALIAVATVPGLAFLIGVTATLAVL